MNQPTILRHWESKSKKREAILRKLPSAQEDDPIYTVTFRAKQRMHTQQYSTLSQAEGDMEEYTGGIVTITELKQRDVKKEPVPNSIPCPRCGKRIPRENFFADSLKLITDHWAKDCPGTKAEEEED